MRYDYRCSKCKQTVEIEKQMERASDTEVCSECGEVMSRVYHPLPTTWADNCKEFDKDGLGNNLVLKHH